ncbi:DUF885 domain-containing protein [Aquabacterium sp.]|uniref:DUF885 domain-containing protein n=1 Tax=Aquabacterium sp. TaxID=1872578 RepID=UPI002BE9428B|nr:DUF885 domain-containing protein [Aquabacterium sp.]HSW05421.1 DUF885 domain-containing protein [Aquabacterium sp.]
MLRIIKWTLLLLLTLVLLAAALLAHTWYFKPLRLDWFYTRVFASFALDKPELLSSLRILPGWADFYSSRLDDASPAADERGAKLVREGYATLQRYDRDALDREGRLSYDTLAYFLRIQVEGEPWLHHDFPVNQQFGVQSDLPNFMTQVHQVNNLADAQAYIARLNAFREKFAQLLESLRLRESKQVIPPRFTVDKVLLQMQGFIQPAPQDHSLYTSFRDKLDKLPEAELDAATRERLLAQAAGAVEQQVYPAYRSLISYMQALRPKADGNHGAWHLPDGERYYAWCIRQHTTTDMTPRQAHELGLAEVARISAQMDEILKAQGLAQGTVGQRVLQLAAQPAQQYPNTPEGRAAMLARYQAIIDEANGKLDTAFDVRPKLGMEVKAVPEFAQATAPAAYYQGGAFDGTRPGVFYANMRDTTETPKFAMRTLAYHEGIPGHHFQIAIAQELQGVPFFRRVLPFTAFAEGWALYAERLAWELGFEPEPLDNLGRLRDEMMRAVRLVVDTGIHAQRWTREQAITYMRDNTGMAEADVVTEIERYFVNPGQALAYKAGMLKILALREKAKLALGARFDLKQFHNEVLTHGALPLVVLERVVDDWIASRRM